MVKDGTNRGGARVGAVRKSKSLIDKIHEGKYSLVVDLPVTSDLRGAEMPPVKYYMTASQKSGHELAAKDVYEES